MAISRAQPASSFGVSKNKRQFTQRGMVDDAPESLEADVSLADLCMSVLMRAQRIHTVVDVHRTQAGKPHRFVKLCQNAVQIVTMS